MTITPAPTSITAFLGRTPQGPVNQPLNVFSYADFTRFYGGLVADYPLTWAVRDFFTNGGSHAVIARLFESNRNDGDGFARLSFPGEPSLTLKAAGPGFWGNALTATVDTEDITPEMAYAAVQYGLVPSDLFNLRVTLPGENGGPSVQESFRAVSVKQTGPAAAFPNRLDLVLQNQSFLARVEAMPSAPPASGSSASASGGYDSIPLSPQTFLGDQNQRTGIYLLDQAEAFNLLCIPPDTRLLPDPSAPGQDLDPSVVLNAAIYCASRRAVFLVDPPASWSAKVTDGQITTIDPAELGITGSTPAGDQIASYAAVYFPRLAEADPHQGGASALFAPCGAIAGVIAANDASRGVWAPPAGQNAGIAGIQHLELTLTDDQTGQLNPLGINCLRTFPVFGPVVWGARTLRGADQFSDDFKYLSVRRLVLFIEQSLYQSLQWAVFEPNNEQLWSALRLTTSQFLAGLYAQGAFYNYAVKCDATTTTPDDIENGVVNLIVEIAPVRPAEFLVIRIQQAAGQSVS